MSDVYILPEIIRAILSWLPVKSLLRFRCVSKPWLSLIDGQDFIKLHLHHSAETSSNRTLIVQSTEILYVDLDSFERLNIGITRSKSMYVAGSCNGLVLILSLLNDVILWNPLTRKVNELSPPCMQPDFLDRFVARRQECALGYDSKHDDYKVVCVTQDVNWRNNEHLSSETHIYSVQTNSWKKIEDFPYKLNHSKRLGVYLNDALHTVVELKHDQLSDAIMAFDLVNEEHYEVPMPEFSDMSRSLWSVDVLGGCFTAVFSGKTNIIEIWVMKEYGVKDSWFKLLCIDPLIHGLCINLYPLVYSKSGDEVLLIDNSVRLIWYNLGNKTVKFVEGFNVSFNAAALELLYDIRICVGSLVSPYGVGVEKENARGDDFLSVGSS